MVKVRTYAISYLYALISLMLLSQLLTSIFDKAKRTTFIALPCTIMEIRRHKIVRYKEASKRTRISMLRPHRKVTLFFRKSSSTTDTAIGSGVLKSNYSVYIMRVPVRKSVDNMFLWHRQATAGVYWLN